MPQRSINQFLIILGNVGKSYPERDLIQQTVIKHWGSKWMFELMPRITLGVTGQGCSPQSSTFHTADR
jgi:hypothetical protein